ncbi:FAD-dependent oxidoreductase [Celerinatantimonas yamalensis]|uniref:FAD-dependent oxidoreductase n=1 Tax=Celerinatantimonas yamalensis TaxID=559956 RepID=A0ABW9GDH7_9GAMM
MRNPKPFRVAIIGGGVAGSICALRLVEAGLSVSLFEQGPELVNGPPICHLHAGGSLYRELSDAQCITLLEQSITTARSFPQALRARPTLIAVPKRDPGRVEDIIPRLDGLVAHYRHLIECCPANQVLGKPEHYYQLFSRSEAEQLARQSVPREAKQAQDWLINAVQRLDLDKLKFPLVLVQEYGVSLFRVAACIEQAVRQLTQFDVHLNSAIEQIEPTSAGFCLHYRQLQQRQHMEVDYLINAAGYRSGDIDDLLGIHKQRLVEFKAAYLARWAHFSGPWPEIVIHGQRGTKNGMAQLTPYGQGVFQLHGMAPGITLFEQGVARSNAQSAQPQLPTNLAPLAQGCWPEPLAAERTQAAIAHLAEFLPEFAKATWLAKPMSGAQQIPGEDLNQRVSGASFVGERYARSEIVKFSSALAAADDILSALSQFTKCSMAHLGQPLTIPASYSSEQINPLARIIVSRRHYPEALAAQILA